MIVKLMFKFLTLDLKRIIVIVSLNMLASIDFIGEYDLKSILLFLFIKFGFLKREKESLYMAVGAVL